ncbi:hypothetical protein [Desulfuribacillus stibiiarsenatis]|uniref:hypothetical protein n=1 Tax=Desulfuribacillus stibiiarsenatis TaxID=1390249 RepID=UPI0015B3810C|nr:hypothetical protein [Desulfuribacillus stibiiarsenatis]
MLECNGSVLVNALIFGGFHLVKNFDREAFINKIEELESTVYTSRLIDAVIAADLERK